MSFCVTAIVAEKKAVNPPITNILNKANGANSNNAEHLIIKKIPAVTKVAACIKADTGVGPSIASGNQVCKPICADLPIDPINKHKHIISKQAIFKFKNETIILVKNGDKTKTTEKSILLKK
jgi:hypothetical protein